MQPGPWDSAPRTAGLIVWLFGFLPTGVLSANVGGKLPVALQFEIPHHFIKGIARGRAGGLEDPGACGTTKTTKTAFFNPCEPASRRHYRWKTKFRVRMFCTIFTLISLKCAASFNAREWPSA